MKAVIKKKKKTKYLSKKESKKLKREKEDATK